VIERPLAGPASQRDHSHMARTPRITSAAMLTLACSLLASSACSGAAAKPSPWWASVQKPGAVQAAAFHRAPGSASYRCVDVHRNRDVRSGGFLAGPFGIDEQMYASSYQQSRQDTRVKIYWVPLQVDHMSELTVRATLLPGRAVARTARLTSVATAGHMVFYPSAVPIPVPGTWELVASAGRNKGCFIATFS
jgi:hypothetical protein